MGNTELWGYVHHIQGRLILTIPSPTMYLVMETHFFP